MQITLNPGGGAFSEVLIENPAAQQTQQQRELARATELEISYLLKFKIWL